MEITSPSRSLRSSSLDRSGCKLEMEMERKEADLVLVLAMVVLLLHRYRDTLRLYLVHKATT